MRGTVLEGLGARETLRCAESMMRASLERVTSREEETIRLGEALGRMLRAGDTILLTGELGTGKTRLAKGIVSAATGVEQAEVVSPSFTLINRFDGAFPVHHADLYRLETDGIDVIGLDEAVEDGGALIVEWAERLRDAWDDALVVTMEYEGATDSRRITVAWDSDGSWSERIRSLTLDLETGSGASLNQANNT